MKRNIARLSQHAASLGVSLRPHLKTTKSVEAARYVLADGVGPATVSTLAEAEVFAAAGITDILYGVGISAPKLDRVIALHRAGCKLTVLLDCVAQAEADDRQPSMAQAQLGRLPDSFSVGSTVGEFLKEFF